MFTNMNELGKIQERPRWEHDGVSHDTLGHLIGNQTGRQVMKETLPWTKYLLWNHKKIIQ